MAVGMGRFAMPCKSFTPGDADTTEEFLLLVFFGTVERASADFEALTALSFFLPLCSSVSSVVVAFVLFLSNLAKLSASHRAFSFPRAAFLLLSHSAESS